MIAIQTDKESLNFRDRTVELSPAFVLLRDLLAAGVICPVDWQNLSPDRRRDFERLSAVPELLAQLVEQKVITPYQADRIGAGRARELILGHYLVLDHLGEGGMAVVLKARHRYLHKPAAIKILRPASAQDGYWSWRFFTEILALGELRHPNIVSALDAGEAVWPDLNGPAAPYLVMEYVPGQDLQEYVKQRGQLRMAEACELIYQVASALAESHKHRLVHRDVKPSNIRVTPEGQAKLLDFGLTRDLHRRVTESKVILGTPCYLAPEQVRDSHVVDIRTDLYGLGASLFWCLTGCVPFPAQGNLVEYLARRQTQTPPSIRTWRPELPVQLDSVVSRMMATDPDDRYPTPDAVMRALLPFIDRESDSARSLADEGAATADAAKGGGDLGRPVLIVDDESPSRTVCRAILESESIGCDEAANGVLALDMLRSKAYDLVLLDIDMPQLRGTDILRRLREAPPCPNLKVIMVSGKASSDEMAQMLLAGADDYLTKPFTPIQLQARVKMALALKRIQDRSDLLNRNLLLINHELEQNLHARDSDLIHARNALTLALAELVAYRDREMGNHVLRLQRYVRRLAEEASLMPCFSEQIDENFIQLLEGSSPLHDIGKVGLPDNILLKSGPYTTEERMIMQSHTTIGATVLQKVGRQHGFATAFLQMAADVARHHHEWFDGTGYPDRLSGSAIPLAARIVAVVDVYDALRSRRVHKPALSHNAALVVMTEKVGRQFDPSLWQAFLGCAADMDRLFRELAD